MHPLRIGIIGISGIAGSHVKHLEKIDGAGVTAIADILPEALERRGKEWGIDPAARYLDYREMLADPAVDAAIVCTPNFAHCEPSIAALEAGKHVMVEKPMAMTVAEAERMVAAAKTSGRQLVVGFQMRFSPKARFLKAQREAGVFGDIHYARVQSWRRRQIPSWGVFTDKEKQGGGALIDSGVHLVEMAHDIMGKPRPLSIFASEWTSIGNRPCDVKCPWGVWKHENYTVEDASIAMVKLEGGATMVVESSFAAHIPRNIANVTIVGSEGGGALDPLQLHYDRNGYMLNAEPEYIGEGNPFAEKMRHFAEVCRGERENESSGEDGLAVQRILNGVYAAAEAGGAVNLQELGDASLAAQG